MTCTTLGDTMCSVIQGEWEIIAIQWTSVLIATVFILKFNHVMGALPSCLEQQMYMYC